MEHINPDLVLTSGLVFCVLSVPVMVSALSDRRTPRVAALLILGGGALVLWALSLKPGGYALTDIPGAVTRAVAILLN